MVLCLFFCATSKSVAQIAVYYTGPGPNSNTSAAICLQGSSPSGCFYIDLENPQKNPPKRLTTTDSLGTISFSANPGAQAHCPYCTPPFTSGVMGYCNKKPIPLKKGNKVLQSITLHTKFGQDNNEQEVAKCKVSTKYDPS